MAEVWIAQRGEYEDRYIAGVYWTAERAMAAHPVTDSMRAQAERTVARWDQRRDTPREHTYGWHHEGHDMWDNGCFGDDGVDVRRWDVE